MESSRNWLWMVLLAVFSAAAVGGCDRASEETRERLQPMAVTKEVTVTNVVTVTKTVVVTNEVTCNSKCVLSPSKRKTLPYAVSTDSMGAAALRKHLQQTGARVIDAKMGSVASIEAPEKVIDNLRATGLVRVTPICPSEKIAAGDCEKVLIIPVSFIDCAPIVDEIRKIGGEVLDVSANGNPSVRAKMDLSKQRKLAERGDVLAIRRDNEK